MFPIISEKEEIKKVEFEEKVEIQVQNYASQGIKREQIIGFLWNQEVDLLLFKTEQEKLGITVGNKELNDVLEISSIGFKTFKISIKDFIFNCY